MSKIYGPYGDIIDRLKGFNDNIDSIVINEAMEEGDEIERMNIDDQMLEGIDNTGASIQPEYAPFTIEIKQALGQPTDRVTLRNEGDFHKGFSLEIAGGKIYADSTDEKTEKLVTKYGEDIFGLTPENLASFVEVFLKPRMIDKFKKVVNG
jgi:hypothetical protein